MDNFRIGLMRYCMRCSIKNKIFQENEKKISTTCSRLIKDGEKSGIISRLKNIFGQSLDFNYEEILALKYKNLLARGMADHGSKNQKLPIHDPDGQKNKKNSNSDGQVEFEGNVEENFPKYVLKQKWGVNLLEPMKLEQRQATNKNIISRFDNVIQSDKKITKSLQKTEMRVINETNSSTINSSGHASILPSTPEHDEALKSLQNQELKYRMNMNLNDNSKTFLSSKNTNEKDEEDLSRELNQEDEILAWQNVIIRTREHIERMSTAGIKTPPENIVEEDEIKFSILPEPPRPKLDVAAVKTIDLYNLIDTYIDPSEPPTAKGIRIALHQVNSKKFSNTSPNQNQSSQQTPKQTYSPK